MCLCVCMYGMYGMYGVVCIFVLFQAALNNIIYAHTHRERERMKMEISWQQLRIKHPTTTTTLPPQRDTEARKTLQVLNWPFFSFSLFLFFHLY